ncbi:alpha/beta hydrolase [Pistricoccus aurantiacus]|uniref:Alpha/beta hydrolase n=1 Tax=Pistricoccus aurantiacus TaxID=1883414 RepID=A0A5B8SSG9_9GAMM|nr:alpha/beta hydrolase [Pistricoccus aurantiacus]QEA39636.1 alpha/beta hydrolase [Pistricoccus aurantiacus]
MRFSFFMQRCRLRPSSMKAGRYGHYSATALIVLLVLLAGCSSGPTGTQAGRPEPSVPLHRTEYLTVAGARLFLMTRGADRHAPVLLWLHGGPGGAERPLFRYYNNDLEKHFVVAYWDQRGAGRSFDPKADPRRLTVARHLADLDVIVDHLRRAFDRDRIILVGHSWGGMLGLLYAQRHPEKVAALIAVAPLISPRESQRQEYAFILSEATRQRDEAALTRLREIGPPPYETADQVLAIESLADRYGAVFHRQPNRFWVLVTGVLRGLVTPWEISRFIRANQVSLKAMTPELLTLDLTRSVPRIEVPVFFLLGRYDHHAGSAIAARYFKALEAPEKRLIWFGHSAHNPPFEEPRRFDKTLERLARTLDTGASSPDHLLQREIQTP